MTAHAYKAEWQKMMDSKTPAEKAAMKRLGVDRPHDDGGRVFTPDVSEVPEQAAPEAYDPLIEKIPDMLVALEKQGHLPEVISWIEQRKFFQSGGAVEAIPGKVGLDSIRIAFDIVLKARVGEVRLAAEVVALVLGLYREEGKSYSDIARKYIKADGKPLSRQVVQTRAEGYMKELNIPATDCSKSLASREVYRLRNHRHVKKTAQLAPVVPFQASDDSQQSAA